MKIYKQNKQIKMDNKQLKLKDSKDETFNDQKMEINNFHSSHYLEELKILFLGEKINFMEDERNCFIVAIDTSSNSHLGNKEHFK
jgi:hypothetical protein